MSVPAPNNREDAYVTAVVTEELNLNKSIPLPEFTNSLQEAAWLRFRVDAILEEWMFSHSGEKIPYRSEYDNFHRYILNLSQR